MRVHNTAIPGCAELQPNLLEDTRGRFVKVFQAEIFAEHRMATRFVEEYYSVSRQRVLRGLHFQTPPHHHAKLVYCVSGTVMDAVVDLRRGSPTFGKHVLVELSAATGNALYVPEGLAHGFYVTSSSATMVYKVTSAYAPRHDSGIRWDTAKIPWPDETPVVSERDTRLEALSEFQSPFDFADRP